MTGETEELPPNQSLDAVKEIPQPAPNQPLWREIANGVRGVLRGTVEDIGSGRAHEILHPGSATKRTLLEKHLSPKGVPPKEPSEP
jgi:hypothetical protein